MKKDNVEKHLSPNTRFSKCIRKILFLDDDAVIPYNDTLEDLWFDSLDVVELIMDLEKEYNIWIPDKEISDLKKPTIKQIYNLLIDKMMENKTVKPITVLQEPKRVAPVVPPHKYTINGYQGLTVQEILENDEFDAEFSSSDQLVFKQVKGLQLSFDVGELNHCCGALLLGSFSIACIPDSHKKKIWAELQPEMIELFNGLPQLLSNKGLTLTCTTTSEKDSPSKLVGHVLEKCSFWTAVKTWKNKNSGNLITLWVSNNE